MRDRSTEGEAGTTDNYSRVRPPPPPNSVASRSRWTSSAVIAAPLSGQTEPLSELIPSEPIRQGEPAVPHSTQSSRAAFVLPPVPLARHADVPATALNRARRKFARSEEHTSELKSLMRISYAAFGLKKKKHTTN